MESFLLYNIVVLFLAVTLIAFFLKVHKSNLNKKIRITFEFISIVLLIGAVGFVLFLDALFFGIIGLVPN